MRRKKQDVSQKCTWIDSLLLMTNLPVLICEQTHVSLQYVMVCVVTAAGFPDSPHHSVTHCAV